MSDVVDEVPVPEAEAVAPAVEEEVAVEPDPALSEGASLPTSDGVEADQIETTTAVTSDKKVFVVWDAVNHSVISGPFGSADDAQIDIDFRSAKASRAVSWTEPSYSIEALSDLN